MDGKVNMVAYFGVVTNDLYQPVGEVFRMGGDEADSLNSLYLMDFNEELCEAYAVI